MDSIHVRLLCDPPVLWAPPNRRYREVVFCLFHVALASRDGSESEYDSQSGAPFYALFDLPRVSYWIILLGSDVVRIDSIDSHLRPQIFPI